MELKMIGTGSIGASRRSASTLIDNKILVDCGNGIVKTMINEGVSVKDIDVLLITHFHGDHFLDIPFLITQRILDDATNELKIYGPKGLTQLVKDLYVLTFHSSSYDEKIEEANITFIEYEALNTMEVLSGYYVTPVEVEHGDLKPSYGFVMKHDNHIISFSGDSSYCPSINELVKSSELSVLDTTFISGNLKHMGLDNVETLIYRFNKKIIPTHMDDLTRAEIQRRNINNIILLDDGDTYTL